MSIIVCPNSLSFSLSALSISCGNTALEASVFPHPTIQRLSITELTDAAIEQLKLLTGSCFIYYISL